MLCQTLGNAGAWERSDAPIMGFSAGGTVTGSVAFNYSPETRPVVKSGLWLALPLSGDKLQSL